MMRWKEFGMGNKEADTKRITEAFLFITSTNENGGDTFCSLYTDFSLACRACEFATIVYMVQAPVW